MAVPALHRARRSVAGNAADPYRQEHASHPVDAGHARPRAPPDTAPRPRHPGTDRPGQLPDTTTRRTITVGGHRLPGTTAQRRHPEHTGWRGRRALATPGRPV